MVWHFSVGWKLTSYAGVQSNIFLQCRNPKSISGNDIVKISVMQQCRQFIVPFAATCDCSWANALPVLMSYKIITTYHFEYAVLDYGSVTVVNLTARCSKIVNSALTTMCLFLLLRVLAVLQGNLFIIIINIISTKTIFSTKLHVFVPW